ncbi:hypothetical protein ACCO45_006301 [Purpureocillium lilacinum]|uniref:Uncharacterized protein n=1 Tax=Purpureocillium lilacinum TaxID=33203 RepID=A0ACC4DU53_PURLI
MASVLPYLCPFQSVAFRELLILWTPSMLWISSKEYIDGGEEKVFVNAPSEAYNWTGISNAPVPIYPLSLDITNNADGCDPLPDTTPDLSGYVVLIRRGTCYFSDKASHAAAKGAKYVLFYDSYLDTTLSRYSIQNANVSAAAMIPARTGQRWVNAIKAGHNVTVLMQYPRDADRSLAFEKRPGVGGSLSTFTSWGPTWEMDMKPVVGAPGGNIWSTWVGGYSAASGTSMATPITAAILALILQVRGPTTPRMLDNLVSTTAKAQNWFDGKSVYPGDLAPVPQQGGGIVQAFDAAYTTTLLDPANLSFNDTDNFVKQHEFVITNKEAPRLLIRSRMSPL